MATKPYPIHHENEIWTAPAELFAKGISLTGKNAAEFLGISKDTLLFHADDLGLTVLRKPPKGWRYFLMSELSRAKERIDTLSLDDLTRSRGGRRETPIFDTDRKKRRRR